MPPEFVSLDWLIAYSWCNVSCSSVLYCLKIGIVSRGSINLKTDSIDGVFFHQEAQNAFSLSVMFVAGMQNV